MLLSKAKPEELNFIETWFDPIARVEILFSDFDNLGHFDKEKCAQVRLYQIPMLSAESAFDFKAMEKYHKLSENETFELRKNVADVYNLGGRLFGKSLCSLKLDIASSSITEFGLKSLLYSIDEKRLRGILGDVEQAMKFHPIFRMFNFACKYKPEITFFSLKNNWRLKGVNLTLKGKSPGNQFYQLHVDKMWGDEVSFETEEVYNKRRDSVSELGSIFRLAGMTNFTRLSPIGKIFYDPLNKEKIINLPRYVNPRWTEKDKEEAIKELQGMESLNYKIFVEGKVIEDGITEFDIERVQQCYNKKKTIKNFEITKDNFTRFKDVIIVERPKNAEKILISSDVGDLQTEIIVHSEIGEHYSYLYNVTLYNLKLDEQEEIFKYLIEKLESNIISLDCGDAFGRVLADHLEAKYGKEHVVRYAGASKITVGFEKNEVGDIILENGKPVEKQEFQSEWSIRRLKDLLYENKVTIPLDYKLNAQISQVVSFRSGTRIRYKCIMENDHLFSAWRVWAIAQWVKAFNTTPKIKQSFGTGANSWDSKKEKK